MKRLTITNPFGDSPIYYLPETDSTMNDAAVLAAQGATSGTIIVAGFQHAGRGRFAERKWVSLPGEGLLFTLILDAEIEKIPPALIPLLTGLGIGLYVEEHTGRRASIKWPNDVIVEGGKISGVLCESKADRIFVGIGLNCLKSGAGKQPAPLQPISLSELGFAGCRPLSIVGPVLGFLKHAYTIENPLAEIEKRLHLIGESVTHLSGAPVEGGRFYGSVEGLGAEGQLVLRERGTGRVHEVFSGELLPGFSPP